MLKPADIPERLSRREPAYEVECVFRPDPERMVRALLIALGCAGDEAGRVLRLRREREEGRTGSP